MTMRRRFRRSFRGRRPRRRTEWFNVERGDIFGLVPTGLGAFRLDTLVPDVETTPFVVLRQRLSITVTPFQAVVAGGGDFSMGILLMSLNEYDSFNTASDTADPALPAEPSRDWMWLWHQNFNRTANYDQGGDLTWNIPVDVIVKRKERESDVLVLVVSNDPGTTINLDFHVMGRILLQFP